MSDEVTLTEGEREWHVCCVKRHLCRDDHFHARNVERIVAARVEQARADERERIAQAIEATYLGPDSGRGYDGSEAPDAHCRNAYDEGLYDAARIAREGGPS